MAAWIEEQPDLFNDMSVTVRPHPHPYRPREQAAAFERLRSVANVTIDSRSALEAQIAACDVAVFCTTSAAAEAIGRGRVVVYAEWNDLWTMDPTKGKEGELSVPKCESASSLKEELLKIAAMTSEDYKRMNAAQQAVAAQIYEPFNSERFHDIVLAETSA